MNTNGNTSLLTGLLSGYMNGKNIKAQRAKAAQDSADAKELSKIKQLEIKANIEKMKREADKEAKLWDILTGGSGTTAPKEEPGTAGGSAYDYKSTAFGSSFGNAASTATPQQGQTKGTALLDILGDPQKLAALKASGLDLTSIANMNQDQNQFVAQQAQSQKNADRTFNFQQENENFDRAQTGFENALSMRNQDLKESESEIIEVVDPATGKKGKQVVNKNTKESLGPVRSEVIDPMGADSAGKLSLAISAKDNIQPLKDLVGAASKIELADARLSTPITEKGRKIQSLFREAVDARIRSATGAAIPDSEWPFYYSQYLPSFLDNKELKNGKIERLGKWVDNYIESIDPNGVRRNNLKNSSETSDDDLIKKYLGKK